MTADGQLTVLPPTVAGGALVLPQGLVDRLMGRRTDPVSTYARQTAEVERRAVDSVLAAERVLGRRPTEMPPNNPPADLPDTAGLQHASGQDVNVYPPTRRLTAASPVPAPLPRHAEPVVPFARPRPFSD